LVQLVERSGVASGWVTAVKGGKCEMIGATAKQGYTSSVIIVVGIVKLEVCVPSLLWRMVAFQHLQSIVSLSGLEGADGYIAIKL